MADATGDCHAEWNTAGPAFYAVVGRWDCALPLVVCWNFKHLANIKREAGSNAVSLLQGWPQVHIVPPCQLPIDETDEDQDL